VIQAATIGPLRPGRTVEEITLSLYMLLIYLARPKSKTRDVHNYKWF